MSPEDTENETDQPDATADEAAAAEVQEGPAVKAGEIPGVDMEPRSTLGEIWAFLRIRKKFWLAPIIIALLLLALLMVLGTQAGVVSPFVYML